ncbi:hypothetical protein SEPCBS119000_003700 [Sporothrix epigloea]|uniref:Uncharacterized protein n=1 Tax=Sporothrix epigloea TaxID=1892477 RepID=A0ABP0DNB7_9PEZI
MSPQNLTNRVQEPTDSVSILQVIDGQTHFTFAGVSELIDELIQEVADAVAQHAVTRGSCSDMQPAMPLHEAYNHFALFLSDPTNLALYKNNEDFDIMDAAADGYGATKAINALSLVRGGSPSTALPQNLRTISDRECFHQILRSYATFLQTYSLARILCLLEDQVTPMDQPACPMPPSIHAYERMLPILRRLAGMHSSECAWMLEWHEFGTYWRNIIENVSDDFATGPAGAPSRLNNFRMHLFRLRIQTPPADVTDAQDPRAVQFASNLMARTRYSDSAGPGGTKEEDLKFLTERFITPAYLRGIRDSSRSGSLLRAQ